MTKDERTAVAFATYQAALKKAQDTYDATIRAICVGADE